MMKKQHISRDIKLLKLYITRTTPDILESFVCTNPVCVSYYATHSMIKI